MKATRSIVPLVSVVGLFVANAMVSAAELYNLDFTPPETGTYEVPFFAGPPTLESSIGPFSDALVFNAVKNYNQIQLPIDVSAPVYELQFDVLLHNLVGIQYAFTILLDTPEVVTLAFQGAGPLGDGKIDMYNYGIFGDFTNDVVYHLDMTMNFPANRWTVTMNNSQTVVAPLNETHLESIRFSMAGGNLDVPGTYAVLDNVVVTAGGAPVFTACPDDITMANDPGQCSALKSFSVAVTGTPEPVVVCRIGTNIINSPFPFPVGTNVVTCIASNAAGTNMCEFVVIVRDTEPPLFTSLQAIPSVLWPPSHQLVPVQLIANATDNCGPTICEIISATSSEPDDATGDGQTDPDIVLIGDLTLKLRAERRGNGSGRVYTIVVGCNDGSNNSSTQTLTVTVAR